MRSLPNFHRILSHSDKKLGGGYLVLPVIKVAYTVHTVTEWCCVTLSIQTNIQYYDILLMTTTILYITDKSVNNLST